MDNQIRPSGGAEAGRWIGEKLALKSSRRLSAEEEEEEGGRKAGREGGGGGGRRLLHVLFLHVFFSVFHFSSFQICLACVTSSTFVVSIDR